MQELTTIKRRKLPVKIVLVDNQKLGMVKQWQQLFFEERYSETDLSDNPDFVLLASAFDIPGRTIFSSDEVEEALTEMLAAKGPYLLHVAIDDAFNVWPLVPPRRIKQRYDGRNGETNMIHSLELTVQQRPEVLERVLRVTRHRGFTITQMQMRMNDDASLSLDMEVDSERAIELLSNQLNKLIDVTQCKVLLPLSLQQTANA